MTVPQILVKQLGARPAMREYLERLQLKERVDAVAPVGEVARLTIGEVVLALVVHSARTSVSAPPLNLIHSLPRSCLIFGQAEKALLPVQITRYTSSAIMVGAPSLCQCRLPLA